MYEGDLLMALHKGGPGYVFSSLCEFLLILVGVYFAYKCSPLAECVLYIFWVGYVC